jgi:hypothetical protein
MDQTEGTVHRSGWAAFGPPKQRRLLARPLRARWPPCPRTRFRPHRRVDRAARRAGLLARRRRRQPAGGPRRAHTVTDGLHVLRTRARRTLSGDSTIRQGVVPAAAHLPYRSVAAAGAGKRGSLLCRTDRFAYG